MSLKPGYKETEIGIIPEDWEVKGLLDVCAFKSGKAHEPFISELGKFVCVNSKFISTEGRVRKYATKNLSPAMVNDILMVMSDLPNGKALAKAYLADEDNVLAVNQRVCSLTSRGDYPKFLFYILNRNKYFLKFDDGVNQTHLLNKVFSRCRISIPNSVREQKAIAEALSDVDALIDSLEALLTKKRNIKTGVMQELLNGRTRLPGFTGDWKEVRLGDIGTMRGGTGFPLRYQGGNSGIPFYKVSDMNNPGNEVVMRIANNYVSANSVKSMGAVLHEPGSIVFAKVGAAVFLERKRILSCRSCIDNNMMSFTLNSSVCDVKFVHHALQRVRFGDLVSTTALPSINGSVVAEVQIPLPLIKEQKAIADVLSDIDAEIEALDKRLTKTRDLKQGMAQELLTGRTRLV